MSSVRREVQERLSPIERELEAWVHDVQDVDPDPAVPVGMLLRCIVIASLRPDLSFFQVLMVCKRSCEAKIQLTELQQHLWKA